MMRQRDEFRMNGIGDALEKLMANFAGPLLEIRHRRIEPVCSLANQFDTQPRAKSAYKGLVAIGLSPANPMIKMSRRNAKSAIRPKLKQNMKKCNRISAAGDAEQEMAVGPQPGFFEDRQNGAEERVRLQDHQRKGMPLLDAHQ